MKKIIGFILTVVLSISVLTGCNLFEQNTRKDYTQIVATIGSVKEEQTVDGEKITFESEPKNIYKYELISYINQNAESISQQPSLEQAVKDCLNLLITRELIFIEADRMIEFCEMEWRVGEKTKVWGEDGKLTEVVDYTDYNRIKELVYDAIDSTLASIRNEVLTEYDNDLPTVESAAVDSETTYPVRETEEEETDEVVREEEPFVPDLARWPGYYGDADSKALGREVMSRFIELLRTSTNAETNYAITKDDEKLFRDDDVAINKVINEQGIEYVYGMIYDTHYIDVLLKQNAEKQVKLERVQAHISDRVSVSSREVREIYNSMVNEQELSYADISNYNTAVKGGSTEILYTPSSKYFYVKHILLPFSDEQTARLTAYKNEGTHTNEQIESFRDGLVAETVVYPHLNGENDMSRPMSVERVYTEVKAAMKTVENDAYAAERLFDDFIYLYNTDPGIFDNAKGYVVETKLEDGESETYKQEFADGAREFKSNGKYRVGMLLDHYVVTDFGVHIMYFASETSAGEEKSLSDYQTPGRYKTYYDIIEDQIRTTKENKEFETWQNNRITYYGNVKKIYETYDKRFKDLYEA